VPTIPTWRVADIVDPDGLPYPVYLKPRCGRASLDNYRADNPDELRAAVRKVPDAIVQPFIQGDEVTIDTLSDLEGRFLAACPRLRLEVKSGQAYRSRTFADPVLVTLARRIVEGLPIVGAANVQCFLTADGPRFFEVNARFGAGTILSIQAGLNGPRALVDLARGRSVGDLTPRPGVLMLRYWQEVFTEQAVAPTAALRGQSVGSAVRTEARAALSVRTADPTAAVRIADPTAAVRTADPTVAARTADPTAPFLE
jgi:carbamoyl-phosphate synthase large subunit